MWLAITQIVLVAILMALQKVRQPQVNSSVLDPAGGTFSVPLAVFVFMTVSVAAGYWFGLAGALRLRASVGIPVAALATWTLADYPVTILGRAVRGQGSYPTPVCSGRNWAFSEPSGSGSPAWLWRGGARGPPGRRSGRTGGPAVAIPGRPGAGACVLAYYALEFAIWVQYLRAGRTVAGTGFLLNGLGVQSVLLPTFLILVLLLGSTDLLEWGEITVRRVIGAARRPWPPWLLTIVTLLVAIAILANVIRLDGSNVLLELAVIGTPAVLIAVLVWLVPGYGKWSAEIRSRAETTGAVVIFVYSTILLSVTSSSSKSSDGHRGSTSGSTRSSALRSRWPRSPPGYSSWRAARWDRNSAAGDCSWSSRRSPLSRPGFLPSCSRPGCPQYSRFGTSPC